MNRTPGPWNVTVSKRWPNTYDIWDDSENIPLGIESCTDGNIALIAAAPDLLEALTHGHTYFIQNNKLTADDREILDEMWAAICKAKGETA